MARRPSTIDRLPPAVRAEIGRLRQDGRTIDEIIDHLKAMSAPSPSRSALGRHLISIEKGSERMRVSHYAVDALMAKVGTTDRESDVVRLNAQLLQTAAFELLMKYGDDDADETPTPDGLMKLARAVEHAVRAQKTGVDALRAARAVAVDEGKAAAAEAVESVQRELGLSAATVDAIKASIFGVKAA